MGWWQDWRTRQRAKKTAKQAPVTVPGDGWRPSADDAELDYFGDVGRHAPSDVAVSRHDVTVHPPTPSEQESPPTSAAAPAPPVSAPEPRRPRPSARPAREPSKTSKAAAAQGATARRRAPKAAPPAPKPAVKKTAAKKTQAKKVAGKKKPAAKRPSSRKKSHGGSATPRGASKRVEARRTTPLKASKPTATHLASDAVASVVSLDAARLRVRPILRGVPAPTSATISKTSGPLAALTREAVLAALEEFDRLGREEFLRTHGFGKARTYMLVYEDQRYDSKAIAGVAHGYLPGRQALRPSDSGWSGGRNSVVPALERLGFTIEVG